MNFMRFTELWSDHQQTTITVSVHSLSDNLHVLSELPECGGEHGEFHEFHDIFSLHALRFRYEFRDTYPLHA